MPASMKYGIEEGDLKTIIATGSIKADSVHEFIEGNYNNAYHEEQS